MPPAKDRAPSRRTLNDRGAPGPSGRPWGDTTIRGHAKKGTGLLNNELYRGRLVWGRQRFVKDPSSGRRVARLNPAGSETVIEVPHLRIVDDELWAAAKARQSEVARPLTDPHTTTPLNDLHRPRFLLSGLLTCGVCGGGYTITAKDRYGCARRGRQGTCSNSRGVQRRELEQRVLDGLRATLLTPDLVAEFVAEYTTEWNRLQREHRAASGQRDRRLADVKRKIAGIISAIERGIITASTKERLEALEAEKLGLEQAPAEPALPAIHPNLAQLYRDKLARLEQELTDPELAAEAKSVLRSLIKTIKIFPGAKRGEVELELHGELGTILAIPQGAKNRSTWGIQVSVVAGTGFEPTTLRFCSGRGRTPTCLRVHALLQNKGVKQDVAAKLKFAIARRLPRQYSKTAPKTAPKMGSQCQGDYCHSRSPPCAARPTTTSAASARRSSIGSRMSMGSCSA